MLLVAMVPCEAKNVMRNDLTFHARISRQRELGDRFSISARALGDRFSISARALFSKQISKPADAFNP